MKTKHIITIHEAPTLQIEGVSCKSPTWTRQQHMCWHMCLHSYTSMLSNYCLWRCVNVVSDVLYAS